MGNSVSGQFNNRPGGALDSYVSELGPDIVYEKSVGSARFLKTVRGRHRNGPLVIKVFIKPSADLTLRDHKARLRNFRDRLTDIPNVYTYQAFVESDKAGYVIRQWLTSNLYDRISTRPFLSLIEKKWFAFQLLCGMKDAHARGAPHGDIKSENVLVTSYNWIYITDFASSKPTYLPEDDPSDFALFFDSSGRRTCYIAPERFYAAGSDIAIEKAERERQSQRDVDVTEAMDVFSMGCVIAELFTEGTPTFTLAQLYKYRDKEINPEVHLAGLEDPGVKALVLSMIALDPETRPSFAIALETYRGSVFPESFYSFLHEYVAGVNEISSPSVFEPKPSHASNLAEPHATTVAHSAAGHNPTVPTTTGGQGLESSYESALPNESDARIDQLWNEFAMLEPHLIATRTEEEAEKRPDRAPARTRTTPFQDMFPVELSIPKRNSRLQGELLANQRAAYEDGPALIVLSLVCSNVRNCIIPSSKLRALDLLLALAVHLTDEAKLDRLIPYVIDLLHDEAAVVRSASIRTLTQVLMLVTVVTPSNASIFPEYIFPNIRHLAVDPEESVRCTFAQCIAPLADTASRYLELGQALKAHGTFKLSDIQDTDETAFEMPYEASLQDLHSAVQDVLTTALVDPASTVKRAVLHNISSLCVFFGRQKTNDVLLSHMITYLNGRDWLLRYAFFDSIVGVAACVGARSLEEYILPLMIQALSDVEETVVYKVLSSLTSLSELGLFQKMRIWELLSATVPFLYHPSIWVRQGAVAFITSSTKLLPPTDVWCILYPGLRQALRADVRSITEQSLLSTLKPPLSRQIFEAAISWAMKSDKSAFWRGQTSKLKSNKESPKELVSNMRNSVVLPRPSSKGDEDDTQIVKLQQLGMASTEETKLVALRDYILKLANTIKSFTARDKDESEIINILHGPVAELQKLGVVPQTVFVGTRAVMSEAPSVYAPTSTTSRRSTLDVTPRPPHLLSPRSVHRAGTDTSSRSGSPFAIDDLRRHLGQMEGSPHGLAVPGRAIGRKDSHSSLASGSGVLSPVVTDPASDAPTLDFAPSSPSESISVLSGAHMNDMRRRHLRQLVQDGRGTAPASIVSTKTVATGTLEAPLKSSDIPVSGRTSPASTVRGEQRPKLRSVGPSALAFESQGANVSNLLEQMQMDTIREGIQDFGPKVPSVPVRRRNVPRGTMASRESGSRKADALLISHMNAHDSRINGIAVSPDHVFFVSCSEDRTVKVWDTARLERNVTTKPRHVYTQHHAPVTCVCIIEGTHCFASAGEDGSLHVVRVHVSASSSLPKYGKLQSVREHRCDQLGEYVTWMSYFNADGSPALLYTTNLSWIVVLDLRTMRFLRVLENPRHFGPITCACLDKKQSWLVIGTTSGVLTLWDLRFGLLLRSWSTSSAADGSRRGIHQIVSYPSKTRTRQVVVAVETTNANAPRTASERLRGAITLEVWDIEKATLEETFAVAETYDTSGDKKQVPEPHALPKEGHPASIDAASAIADLIRSRRAREKTQESIKQESDSLPTDIVVDPDAPVHAWMRPDVHALLALPDNNSLAQASLVGRKELDPASSSVKDKTRGGMLLLGTEARRIHLWDLARLERSLVLSGQDPEQGPPFYHTHTPDGQGMTTHTVTFPHPSATPAQNRGQSRSMLTAQHHQTVMKGHTDAITALACTDLPFKGGIISGDASGALKVFKIE
ncbi:phosphoinositide 3-kinase regulatory subunit 4 [Rhizoctonia solani 123E]|uniref:non-specific serine/threonine protein kinase n=1 Tax=Rhizoctonia solani 123E TaxID=1423351 RepID=A0A074SE09_9AGAM|nr:phosphoinositide 3-kinase regulatory subunit 4 [Rhizoctonia solani 123E]